nr:uncharacterized mitochondrial protein AtMg00810-like [Tanacetum cinerariifolium]
ISKRVFYFLLKFKMKRYSYADLLKVCRELMMPAWLLNCLAFKLEEIVMAMMTCLKSSGVHVLRRRTSTIQVTRSLVLVDLPNGKRAIGTKWVFKNKKDGKGIVKEIKQDRLLKGFEDPNFSDRVYKVKKALYGLHQAPKAWFIEVKTASTPMETQKPLLKDKDVCACARYQVNPKVYHLHVVKRIFRYLKRQPNLGLWYSKDSPFDLVAYTDSDYAGVSLDRKSKTGDGKEIVITGSSFRRDLQLANEEGIDCLPNSTIFEQLALMGVESSGNEESLGEDTSKQGRRIDAIDADEDITLVNNADKEMFDVDDLGGEEVFVTGKNDNVVEEGVNAAQVSTAATTVTITTEKITLAQALEALKTSKPKVKGIVFQEPGKYTTTTTISSQQSQDKGKGIIIEEPVKPKKKDQIRLDEEAAKKKGYIILTTLREKTKHFTAKRAEEKRNKPPTKAQQRKITCTYLKNMEGYKLKDLNLEEFDSIQEMFDIAFKRQKVDDDKEKAKLKQLMETILDEEEVAIDAIPLAVKSLRIVD